MRARKPATQSSSEAEVVEVAAAKVDATADDEVADDEENDDSAVDCSALCVAVRVEALCGGDEM